MKRLSCFKVLVFLVSTILIGLSGCQRNSNSNTDTIPVENSVDILQENFYLAATLENVNISIDGRVLENEVIMYEGRTYIQLRRFAEMLGFDVGWDDDLRMVRLSSTSNLSPTHFAVSTTERENADFRNAIWGDSPEIVMRYETADFFDASNPTVVNNRLLYVGAIAGIDTYIIYIFHPDLGLYSAIYGLQQNHTTFQIYITTFNRLKDILTERFGEPTTDEILTLSDLADLTDEGTALVRGHRAYRTTWQTDTTEITLGMMADNREILTVIQYTSRNVIPPIDTTGF